MQSRVDQLVRLFRWGLIHVGIIKAGGRTLTGADQLGRLERCRVSTESTIGCDDPKERATRDDDTSDENTSMEAVLVAIIRAGTRLSGDARRRIRAIVAEETTER